MQIPDFVSTSVLAQLLADRQQDLPQIEFSDEHPSELGFLIGFLFSKTPSGQAPSLAHMVHASICLTATVMTVLAHNCASRTTTAESPLEAVAAVALNTEVCHANTAKQALVELAQLMSHRLKVNMDGSVSEQFLNSVGLSQQEFQELRQKAQQL